MSTDRIALTALVGPPGTPLLFEDRHRALKLALVRRDAGDRLDASWMTSGVYVRLGRGIGGVNAYVGQASDLTRRIGQHADNPDVAWSHALLLAHAATPYTEAEYCYLEGELHTALAGMGYTMVNVQEPGSDRLAEWDMNALAGVVPHVTRLLAGVGWGPNDALESGSSWHTAPLSRALRQLSDADPAAGESFWWALADGLSVERARRGEAGAPRKALAPNGQPVGQQTAGSLTLSIEAIAREFGWSEDLVRSELAWSWPFRPLPGMSQGGALARWRNDLQKVARSLAAFKGEHALPFGQSVASAAPARPVASTLKQAAVEAARYLVVTNEKAVTITNRFGRTRDVGSVMRAQYEGDRKSLEKDWPLLICVPTLGVSLGWTVRLIDDMMAALGAHEGWLELGSLITARSLFRSVSKATPPSNDPSSLRA